MRTVKYILVPLVALILSACNTSKKIIYLQDARLDQPEDITSVQTIVIEPKDMLSIIVSSPDPKIAAIFNNQAITNQAGNRQILIAKLPNRLCSRQRRIHRLSATWQNQGKRPQPLATSGTDFLHSYRKRISERRYRDRRLHELQSVACRRSHQARHIHHKGR